MIDKETALKIIEAIDKLAEQVEFVRGLLKQQIEPDNFLAEISQPIPLIADEPEQEPQTPNLDDVEILETTAKVESEPSNSKTELIERFDLEQISTIDDKTWTRFVKTVVLAGWDVKRLLASDACKGVQFTTNELKLLEQLAGIREMMLAKQMDTNAATSQDGLGEIEKAVIVELANKNNLK